MPENYLNRIVALHDGIIKLESLAPGQGYDALGFEMCDLVSESSLSYETREKLLQDLDQNLLHDLQKASVESEMRFEEYFADKICGLRHDDHALAVLSPHERIQKILSIYPYNWSGIRVHQELDLIQACHAGSLEHIIYMGKSMLPFSGLNMHLESGAQIDWLDLNQDSAHTAQKFIANLEKNDALTANVVRIHHAHAAQDVAAYLSQETAAVVIMDDDLMGGDIFALCHERGIPMVLVEPKGMCHLMYPDHERANPRDFGFEPVMTVLAQHALDEPVDAPIVKIADKGMFVSLTAYKPI